jgi:uncharacterized protein (TIGR02145 family)
MHKYALNFGIGIAILLTLPSCNNTGSSLSVDQESSSTSAYCKTVGNCGSFIDTRDGNKYNWTKIGNQIWMAENLAYLPRVTGMEQVSIDAEYYVYGYKGTNVSEAKNDSNYTNFGVLYNWAAAMDGVYPIDTLQEGIQGVCPYNWHLPSKEEWNTLIDFIGTVETAGTMLRSSSLWPQPTGIIYEDTSVVDSYGFRGLPSGFFDKNNKFGGTYELATFWSSSGDGFSMVWGYAILQFEARLYEIKYEPVEAVSIRCVKD